MSEWQPMESAPRDGRVFLVYDSEIGVPVHCRWDFGSKTFQLFVPTMFACRPDGALGAATHWIDLKAPKDG